MSPATQAGPRMGARLGRRCAVAYRRADHTTRICLWVAGLLLLSGLLHLALQIVGDRPWSGPVSWRKPATFGLSFGLTLLTMVWVTGLMSLRQRIRAGVLGTYLVAFVIEVVGITVPAWRGLPSHFGGADSSGDVSGLFAALGALGILVTSSVLTALAMHPAPYNAQSMRLAVRAGLCSFMVALAVGVLMLARGMLLARAGPGVDAAFAYTATLKPGHAATMHGVLILPVIAWLAGFVPRTETYRLRLVRLATAGYLLFAGVVVIECLAAIDPIAVTAAPPIATALASAGAVLLVGAGITVLRDLARFGTRGELLL